jgi:hypothetical protein
MSTKGKIIAWVVGILLVAAALTCYFKFFFVFGQGVKAGELNQLVYKGWVWKTYEGRLIQAGFKSGGKSGTSLQSNEFNFSVVSKSVADSLMRCSGRNVELHYKEYNGTLPWRGMQRYVVDKIISISPAEGTTEIPVVTGGETI